VGCFDRGILSTIYTKPVKGISTDELIGLYKNFYNKERFVNILTEAPKVKDVAGTNYCQIYTASVRGMIVVFTAIDNLVKGASGQAIQNLNIMFGLDESLGLV
jgi:N-acetyl-gamma-glutamyl-phosphate reductase